jgi:predicted dehydrogenase
MAMTEQEKQLGRRNFMRAVATLPVAGALLWKSSSIQPVRAGIIGPGGQGRVLMENSNPNFLKLVAVCDIYPPNLEKGLEIARKNHDANAQGYADYRQLLERKDIEAVLIAVPLWAHGPIAVEALQAGKHVFCEKTMAYTVEDCKNMIQAARTARRNLQIGHQRAYSPLYHEAYQLINEGTIGEIYHVRALWHRNGDWRRKPADPKFDPSPWGYPSIEHLTNWRLYSKYSHGMMAELCSHQVHVVNWFTSAAPQAVVGTGGIHRYKDGREVNDHIYTIFEYPKNLTLTYSAIQSNAFDHYYEEFMGTKGTIILGGETEALLFMEGQRGKPSELTVTAETGGPVMQASESRSRDAAGSSVAGAGSSGFSAVTAYKLEIEGFARTIRNGEPNLCDGETGLKAATAILKADEAIAQNRKLEIGRDLYTQA